MAALRRGREVCVFLFSGRPLGNGPREVREVGTASASGQTKRERRIDARASRPIRSLHFPLLSPSFSLIRSLSLSLSSKPVLGYFYTPCPTSSKSPNSVNPPTHTLSFNAPSSPLSLSLSSYAFTLTHYDNEDYFLSRTPRSRRLDRTGSRHRRQRKDVRQTRGPFTFRVSLSYALLSY